MANLTFAWCWFLAGVLSGAVVGLWFHRDEWLGGYNSWRRRMLRLGHIAFFGTGLLNLCFSLTVVSVDLQGPLVDWASIALIVGAVAMPTVCFLSAWRKPLRHLFFVPVLSLLAGVALTAAMLVRSPG